MSGKGDGRGKKRKKSYYRKCSGKKPRRNLEADMKGFLITFNNREKDARREAYSLLNEYADKLYGPEQMSKPDKEGVSSGSESEDEDIEAALAKEVSAIKDLQKKERRFQILPSGANNCLFVKTTLETPTQLVYTILNDVNESKTSKSRYMMRMLPVEGTCKAQEDRIQKLAIEIFSKTFKEKGSTYSIQIKVRNNNTIGRKELLPLIGEIIKSLNPANSVNLKEPDYVINIDIIRNVFCISVLEDFFKLKKYNIQEVAHKKSEVTKTDMLTKVEDTVVDKSDDAGKEISCDVEVSKEIEEKDKDCEKESKSCENSVDVDSINEEKENNSETNVDDIKNIDEEVDDTKEN